ncbi:MAG TPA: chemotaxis protein CheB [Ktedonobacteraceae bacterium]|nr:chemotaxis protein CheB [Ktedonobacteraceae bacterium]
MPGHDVIVVGASAGGVEALARLVGSLPADLPAAMFLVLHVPAQSPSLLPEILNRAGPLQATHPADGETIQYGRIYVAPPDHHLLVEEGIVRIVRGPKENRHRPAVDPLFRSAARTYGTRVVGVILTGSLDDGTAGLLAIKRRGGVTVVQDPHDALFSSMSLSAIAHVEVDHVLPLSAIGPLLVRLAHEQTEAEGSYPISKELEMETKLAAMDMSAMQNGEYVGTPSVFSCPECGGVLWEVHDGNLLRFRCRVGHAYSVDSVLAGQSEAVEEALWTALKTLEESASLSRRMAKKAREGGKAWLAKRFDEKAQEAEQHTSLIRQVLVRGGMDTTLNTSADLDTTGEQEAVAASQDELQNEE